VTWSRCGQTPGSQSGLVKTLPDEAIGEEAAEYCIYLPYRSNKNVDKTKRSAMLDNDLNFGQSQRSRFISPAVFPLDRSRTKCFR
jgi:hypothetical protein